MRNRNGKPGGSMTGLRNRSVLVVVEMGAGRVLPTVRHFSECHGPRVVRINSREHQIAPHVGVGIAGGAMATLARINQLLIA